MLPALLEELRTVVPHFGSSVFFLGPTGELENIYDENPAAPHVAPLYLQEFYNHPDREMGTGFADGIRRPFGVQGFEEVINVELSEFHRSDYFNLILRPLGYDDIIRLAFWDGGHPVGGIMLSRGPNQLPFSESDRRRLARLGPFFAHAMANRGAEDGPLVDSGRHGLIIADTEGRVRHSSAEGRRLLFLASNPYVRATGSASDPAVLPRALMTICKSLADVFAGDPVRSPPVHHERNAWGGFRFVGDWLRDDDRGPGLIGISITHEEPLPLKLSRNAARLSLSGRQTEICVLVAGGATHESIAERLGISIHTSITHTRAVYHKLGVHNRSELLSKLLVS